MPTIHQILFDNGLEVVSHANWWDSVPLPVVYRSGTNPCAG